MPENSIEFEGVAVSVEEWKKALAIYSDPDGGMF
jgi:hypothetical protein